MVRLLSYYRGKKGVQGKIARNAEIIFFIAFKNAESEQGGRQKAAYDSERAYD